MIIAHAWSCLPILAQIHAQRDEEIKVFGVFAAFFGIFCGVGLLLLAIQAVTCWFLSSCLKAIPEAHRKQQPGMVWLLMIPLFNVVWNFFVYPKIAESYNSYFDSIGRTDVADCGRGLALAFCIIVCCMIIPYLNVCVAVAALIVWIIVLVKFSHLKAQVVAGTGGIQPT